MVEKIILATRKSPLALKQTQLTIEYLKSRLPKKDYEMLLVTTTGDRQKDWSLEQYGGKGLFTKELEEALLNGRAHIAVHSAKDLPTTLPNQLMIVGFLPREIPYDVLVVREDVATPKVIVTSSPRRRAQASKLFPEASWVTIRGTVETRLKKIVGGDADASIFAAAGLKRLGIDSWPGLIFKSFSTEEIVPAVGQGAIALECTEAFAPHLKDVLDAKTWFAVSIERMFLDALGGGCHAAFAAYFQDGQLSVFHENVGFKRFPFPYSSPADVREAINNIASELLPV